MEMVSGVVAVITGAVGDVDASRSAEPDFEVEALLPCFATRRRDEARIEAVVLILNVL